MTHLRTIFALATVLVVTGCATQKDLYYWDNYEFVILDNYVEPGKNDVQSQIVLLSEDIENASSKGLAVPPGVYVHLGMLYAQLGNVSASRTAFKKEIQLFPEAKHFVQGMIKRSGMEAL